MGGIVPMGNSGHPGALPATSDEMSRLLTAVRRGRVLTVTGPVREQRALLVREIARRVASNFYDGVTFVSLERTTGVRELVEALGCVPGMPFLPCGGANAASWLAERDMLLVVEGCDRLDAAALGWLRKLLAVAPGVRLLAAGRYPLIMEQERVHRL
ncbi:hypothetical protein [Streptomyces sp. NPDC090022]|uniref:hypothetical protein n=1 Tax=Streptomyces sp. NPDC090022 TaxID=3365920 RepID=UPI0038248B8F